MSGAPRFVAVLVVGLALLTAGALWVVNGATRRWFESDLMLRSKLAVAGSERALVSSWQRGEWEALREVLTDITRDERDALRFLMLAFAVLAAGASLLTLMAARLSWRGFSNQLRNVLRGGQSAPQFQPLLQDVRELVERLAIEKEVEGPGAWTPQRL